MMTIHFHDSHYSNSILKHVFRREFLFIVFCLFVFYSLSIGVCLDRKCNYSEGGDDEVADFQVSLPQSIGDDLLEFQEAGLGIEDGGDGGDAHIRRFGLVQNDGHDSGQELVFVDEAQGSQGVDDVGAQSLRHHSALGVSDEAFDGRRDLGVGKSHQSHHLLLVSSRILEGFHSLATVLGHGVGSAGSSIGETGQSYQVAERQADGSSQFPIPNTSKTSSSVPAFSGWIVNHK